MEIPVACTLTAAGARERAGEWRDLLATASEVARPWPTVVRVRFAADAAARVAALAAAEVACCAFFDFTLEISAAGCWLTIEVPADAQPVLDDLAAMALQAAPPGQGG